MVYELSLPNYPGDSSNLIVFFFPPVNLPYVDSIIRPNNLEGKKENVPSAANVTAGHKTTTSEGPSVVEALMVLVCLNGLVFRRFLHGLEDLKFTWERKTMTEKEKKNIHFRNNLGGKWWGRKFGPLIQGPWKVLLGDLQRAQLMIESMLCENRTATRI